MAKQKNEAKGPRKGPRPSPPTYGMNDAEKLRAMAASLFLSVRPGNIPSDIFNSPYEMRQRLCGFLSDIADEIESAPGPVEIELIAPALSPYTVEDSRNLLYLVRTALV